MYNVSKCPGCVFPSTPVCWQHRAAFSHWPQHVRAQQVNTVSTFLSLHLLVIPQLTSFLFLSTCTYKWRQIDTFLSGGKQQPFMRPPIVHCWQSGSLGCSFNAFQWLKFRIMRSGSWESLTICFLVKGLDLRRKARMWSASSPCSCSACNTWHHEQFY